MKERDLMPLADGDHEFMAKAVVFVYAKDEASAIAEIDNINLSTDVVRVDVLDWVDNGKIEPKAGTSAASE